MDDNKFNMVMAYGTLGYPKATGLVAEIDRGYAGCGIMASEPQIKVINYD